MGILSAVLVYSTLMRYIFAMSAHEKAATQEAIDFYRSGLTAYAAAKRSRIALSTIYRAIKRRRDAALSEVRRDAFLDAVVASANRRLSPQRQIKSWYVSEGGGHFYQIRFVTAMRDRRRAPAIWTTCVSQQLTTSDHAITFVAQAVYEGIRDIRAT